MNAPDIARFSEPLDAKLRAEIPDQPAELAGMIRYHLGWLDADFHPIRGPSGKRLRPILCLLSCEAAGGDFQRALPAAAALELLHNFSLVHDDIQDQSMERRHRRTVWAIWGVAQAINAGDGLFVLAQQALSRLKDSGLPLAVVLAAVDQFNTAAFALCRGQYLDMSFENRADVSSAEYLEMVRGKTAALLGCSASLGALVGSGDTAVAAAYLRFGENLGTAFQIQDDILGIWGDPSVTGKPAADDLRARKKTLPLVHALEMLAGRDHDRLRALLAKPVLTEDQVAEGIAILDAADVRAQAGRLAAEWLDRALVALDVAGPRPDARDQLYQLAASLIGRTH